jgi:hypothetical protein
MENRQSAGLRLRETAEALYIDSKERGTTLMAKQQAEPSAKTGGKYPLLVYRFIARRYRPAGVLLFIVGLIALLPWWIEELRPKNFILTYQQLAYMGIGALVLGALIWILSLRIERRAYVQCLPQYMIIRAPFHSVAVAYPRFNSIQPVQVGRIFDVKAIKGRERHFIKPLAGENAIEAEVGEFPVPEKRLKRHFSRFLLDPREKGFIFIVPRPQQLSIELNTYMQRAMDEHKGEQQRYLDPIERLKYQEPNKLY